MRDFDNERDRFGSAGFMDPHHASLRPHFKKTPDSMFVCFIGKRKLYWNGMGGVLLVAGARGGKLRDILAYNILDSMYCGTLLILDMKGELAVISQNQTKGGKHNIYWNPSGLMGMPQDRINPVDYIHKDNPLLVSYVKMFVENMISLTGSANAEYFERRGREFLEAIILTLVEVDGALTLPRLYEIINLIPGNTARWLAFAFEMSESGYEMPVRIEQEIAASHKNPGGGMQGILGEIFKSFTALSDPALMASVSPPYTASLSQLCDSKQRYNFYMMPPAEFIESWGPIIKALLVGAYLYKSRAPHAPRQTWILDECAQLTGFPLISKLYSLGAGIGIRPVAVFQSTSQMKALGPDAENIIPSSAAVQIYFAVRDYSSASLLSNRLGHQTLEYDDTLARSKAMMAKKAAVRAVLNGAHPSEEGVKLAHYTQAAQHRTKQKRLQRTPDEILNTPDNKAYVFMDGLPHAVYGDRKPYWEQRDLAGRFHSNPYHPPQNDKHIGHVRVKTFFGYRWCKIMNGPVPAAFAKHPQYASGTWSYVEGYE
ncbi:MAG: type IV secretory system conjugative DNA transfer family protein [Kordiimonadaceae bacterium]|nr:type IV secretory system conjugative DNA transfer family protein [Kordiimonadaceae bacterium]